MVTLDNLYTVFKSSVRFASKDSWLQTFAVLNSLADLNSPNLNKVPEDYGKPYFYSRAWEASGYNTSDISFTYPGLFIIETGRSYDFSYDQPTKITVKLEILVADRYVEGKIIQEIERDTAFMLNQVLDYFRYVNAYSDGSNIFYLHSDHADWLGNLTKLVPETTSFKDSILKLFRGNVSGFTLGLGSDDLYGTFIRTEFLEYGLCEYPEPTWYEYDGYLKDLSCGCK